MMKKNLNKVQNIIFSNGIMPDIRPVSITPMSVGISARRAAIMSKKLGCDYNTIHELGKDKSGRFRYHPCASPEDFRKRYLKYVVKADIAVNPSIYLNSNGEWIINI